MPWEAMCTNVWHSTVLYKIWRLFTVFGAMLTLGDALQLSFLQQCLASEQSHWSSTVFRHVC